jgi:hypothetical protein
VKEGYEGRRDYHSTGGKFLGGFSWIVKGSLSSVVGKG